MQIRGRGDYSEQFRRECLERHHRNVARLKDARSRDVIAGRKGKGERHDVYAVIVDEVGIDAARSAWVTAFGKSEK
jgi:hypothetical protein